MKTIVIFITGGVITSVRTDGEPVNIEVVDFDDLEDCLGGPAADLRASEIMEKYPLELF